MKRFILILMLFFALPAFSQAEENSTVLNGSIQYTVDSARKLAFSGLSLKLDKKELEPFWSDKNRDENVAAIKSRKEFADRYIMSFSSGIVKGYAVTYKNKPEYSYYYTQGGYLAAVDFDPNSDKEIFPYKVGKYDAFGRLISVGLYISEEEQYSYTKSGKLKAHWVGDIGYNDKGRVIANRKMLENDPLN